MITTSTMLLVGLHDERNDAIWSEFCDRYRPMLFAVARRLGLSEHEAHDAVQETFLAFVGAYRRNQYERSKGRLRSWLSGIMANKIVDIHRRRPKELHFGDNGSSTGVIGRVPDERTINEAWEAEEARAVLGQCIELVRAEFQPTTMKAFELFALEEWAAERVAQQLGMSRNAVYKAKSKVLLRIREHREYISDNW